MKYVFANWKMYLTYGESIELAARVARVPFDATKIKPVVCPTFLAIPEVGQRLRETGYGLGAQNCAWVPKGAYTGAVSAFMLRDVGCQYVIVGHSERRHIFGETGDAVRKKIEACLDVGITPIVCVGETREEKESGKREYQLKKQLMKAFEGLDLNGGSIMVAYEPVWAIGTGEACLPADVDDIHGWISLELQQYGDWDIPVIYGGSVNSENVVSYVSRGTVDGVLVGSESTKFDAFQGILRAVESAA